MERNCPSLPPPSSDEKIDDDAGSAREIADGAAFFSAGAACLSRRCVNRCSVCRRMAALLSPVAFGTVLVAPVLVLAAGLLSVIRRRLDR